MFLSACLLAVMPGAAMGQEAASVATADGGKLLFVAVKGYTTDRTDATGRVCVWDLSKPELKAVVRGLPGDVLSVQPSSDGKRFTLIGGGSWLVTRIETYDLAGKKIHAMELGKNRYATAVASPNGNWVAYRPNAEKAEVWVWNAETGKRAENVEKAVGETAGQPAFSADDKKLVIASREEYSEFDLATGQKSGGWKRKEAVARSPFEHGGKLAVLRGGKGAVSVAGTGNRRQSYVIRIVTEKDNWFVGEFWDFATAPTISPDGRLLIVSGGARLTDRGAFALKLGADGAPEMEERTEKSVGPWVPWRDKMVPAWREWALGSGTRAGIELPGAMAFSPDGKRLFVGGRLNRLHVHDPERRVQTATLFATEPAKDELPAWHIVTAAGEFVASPAEAEALAKRGKVKDAAKLKEALGVK